MKFKSFLKETHDNEKLNLIFDMLGEMGEEEIKDLGYSLYYEFFDSDSDIEEYNDFCLDDVKDMISKLEPEYYDEILDLLYPDMFDDDEETIELDDQFYKSFYDEFNIDEIDESNINEALSVIGRLKRAMSAKRNAKKMQKAKSRKERKTFLNKDDLVKRSRRLAVSILRAKWSKGRTDKNTKERVENRLSASKDLISRLASKQRKTVIKNYKQKIAARKAASKGINKEE